MVSEKYRDLYLSTTSGQLKKLSDFLLYLEKKPHNQNLLENIFRLLHSMKGAAATMAYKKTVNLLHAMETVIDGAYHNDLEINRAILEVFFNTLNTLQDNAAHIKQNNQEKDLDQATEILRKLFVKKIKPTKARQVISRREKHILGSLPAIAELTVSTEKLDQLSTSLDDLLVSVMDVKNRAQQIGDAKLLTGCLQADKFLGDLRRQLKQLRIVPLAQIFSSLPYLVREVARNENKQAELIIKDNNLSLDKAILDELVEIIIQLLKNAVSHGISVNQSKGKIILEAALINDRLEVKVEDNGQGINWPDILDMAVKNKIISRIASKKMTLKQIKDLIFQPGISKGKTLTTISGRGIGLSLVKSKVEELGGMIEVDSQFGRSTIFAISMPLPMSVFRSVILHWADFYLAIPMSNIDTLVKLDEVKDFSKHKTFTYKRAKFKIIYLDKLMELPKFEALCKYMILLKKGSDRLAIPVASNVTEAELIMKKTPPILKGYQTIKGVAVSASGRPILVLDINSFK